MVRFTNLRRSRALVPCLVALFLISACAADVDGGPARVDEKSRPFDSCSVIKGTGGTLYHQEGCPEVHAFSLDRGVAIDTAGHELPIIDFSEECATRTPDDPWPVQCDIVFTSPPEWCNVTKQEWGALDYQASNGRPFNIGGEEFAFLCPEIVAFSITADCAFERPCGSALRADGHEYPLVGHSWLCERRTSDNPWPANCGVTYELH